MANFVSPNQIQIQIGLVLLVRHDTRDDTSQPCQRRSEKGPAPREEGGRGRRCRSSTGNSRRRCCSLSSNRFHSCSRMKGELGQSRYEDTACVTRKSIPLSRVWISATRGENKNFFLVSLLEMDFFLVMRNHI